ncbi:dethiobiotin synthase [Sphingobacterium sp. SYP-B4668]|uniref:dethiobiotin synthase n=1 Tax=Sphingobacterium sp. SYP-B4668 TaxID=2996035 RepID=UPI0022DD99B6|nr:dethiobiotin synthase [Sphingobacterium sp. SYP-B4668]
MKESIFVTGIGTGVGKTICAAVLTQYWKADYWKPVQSGDLSASDSMTVSHLLNGDVLIHPERYRLTFPASPHKSALRDGVSIQLTDFKLPITANHLVVEGAGGLLVPLNDEDSILDLIMSLDIPVALVVRDYLGCINHSLLSIEVLRNRHIPLKYLIFNGAIDIDSERVIRRSLTKDTKVLHMPELEVVTAIHIKNIADQIIF